MYPRRILLSRTARGLVYSNKNTADKGSRCATPSQCNLTGHILSDVLPGTCGRIIS